jgi:hypothetical protein
MSCEMSEARTWVLNQGFSHQLWVRDTGTRKQCVCVLGGGAVVNNVCKLSSRREIKDELSRKVSCCLSQRDGQRLTIYNKLHFHLSLISRFCQLKRSHKQLSKIIVFLPKRFAFLLILEHRNIL